MELKTAILTTIIIFVLSYIIGRSVHIANFSSLAVASLISIIFLLFMYPPNKIDFMAKEGKAWIKFYVILVIFFLLVIGAYVIIKAMSDRNTPPTKNQPLPSLDEVEENNKQIGPQNVERIVLS